MATDDTRWPLPCTRAGLIEENPELLVRMDYYLDARLLDELPVEIQNVSQDPRPALTSFFDRFDWF